MRRPMSTVSRARRALMRLMLALPRLGRARISASGHRSTLTIPPRWT